MAFIPMSGGGGNLTYKSATFNGASSVSISCNEGDIIFIAYSRSASVVVNFNGANAVNGSISGLIRRTTLNGNSQVALSVKATQKSNTLSTSGQTVAGFYVVVSCT